MDNIDYKGKVGFVPAGDGGRVAIVLSFASESPSLLGAEVPVYASVHLLSARSSFPSQRRRIVPGPQACGAKNALVKDVQQALLQKGVAADHQAGGVLRLGRREALQDPPGGRGALHLADDGPAQTRRAGRRRALPGVSAGHGVRR